MRSVTAYGVPFAGAPIEKMAIERRDLGDLDVLIEIAFVGICHSDLHNALDEWGHTTFPLVPGHEITGVVRATGPSVSGFGEGDRVGVGVIVDSCRRCGQCLRGNEQYCEDGPVETYNSVDRTGNRTYGGYSTHIVVDEHFVYRIPDALTMEEAGPLLCAGITVYSPLRHWGAGPGTRVAVVGLGGLGHMAVKLAHALGAEVTVLSRTAGKRADSIRLGAVRHVATSEPGVLAGAQGSFDLVVSTVSASLDLDRFLSLLDVDGVYVNVGLPPEPLALGAGSLVGRRRSIAGSMIGGVAETQEMLDFCASHGLGADVEVVSAAEIDGAWRRLLRGDVRYRFVVDAATF